MAEKDVLCKMTQVLVTSQTKMTDKEIKQLLISAAKPFAMLQSYERELTALLRANKKELTDRALCASPKKTKRLGHFYMVTAHGNVNKYRHML
jgi:hypothetical protein